MHNNSKITSDGSMRSRLMVASNNLQDYNFLFQLLLSIYWLGIMDNLNETFQGKQKSLCELMELHKKSISFLKLSRTDNY